ncbi:MAG: signal peptidase II [Gammaproteobacteria bacterium]|nr:signal peptidase II [Gammaproteobacteria bacterium]
MNESKTGALSWLWLSALVLVLDQASKLYVAAHFQYGEAVNVLPFFDLRYVHNTGAAFSFLSDAGGWQRWFFAGLAAVISLGLVYWLKTLPRAERWNACALALILGGAVGNLYDRVAYGYVIDFLDFYFGFFRPILGTEHFPAFNIADSGICVGAIMLVIDSFRKKEANTESPA